LSVGVCQFRVFVNRILTRIFVPMREDLVGRWRRLHNEKLQNMYSSANIIRRIGEQVCNKHKRDEKSIQHFGRKT